MTTHKYYDSTVVNNELFAVSATINDIRGQHIIEYPEDWEMSVVRFDINTSLIPPSSIPMSAGAILGTPSPSLLSFTMVFAGTDFQTFLLDDTLGEIFGISKLLDEMNICLLTVFGSIVGAPIETTPPMLVYESATQLITMYYEGAYATVGDIELWSNTPMREKLVALPIVEFAGFNQLNGKDFRYSFTSGARKNAPLLIAGVRNEYPVETNTIIDPMMYVPQEAVVISSWNTARSIKLISSSLPIIAQSEPNNFNISQQGGFSSTSTQTISDFLLSNVDNPIADRLSIEYLPTAEYRMISLGGREPIIRIQIQAFFTTLTGQILPIMLPPNGIFGVKLMFRRRELEIHGRRK